MNKQEWEFAHVACPNCGNTNLRQTLIGIAEVDDNYEDCVNSADCSECGWSGMVKDLVPANTGQEKPMPIKMLDYEGETYAATKDVVVAMLDFNKKLDVTLPSQDQRDFATAVITEMTKMLIAVDKQHWVNKYNFQEQAKKKDAQDAKDQLDGKTGGNE